MSRFPSTASTWRTTLLLLVILASAGIYVALAWRYQLLDLLPIRRANVGGLSKYQWSSAAWLAAAGIGLHALYIVGALLCWRIPPTRQVVWFVWGEAVLVAVLLVAIFPITSTDIFDYLFRGRMAAVYGKNPYIDPPNVVRRDPLFNTVGWPNAPSAYGPLWEMLSYGLAWLGGASLRDNVLLHKAVGVLTYLACGAVIWRITKPSGRRTQLVGAFLWLWSPLTLWEIIAAGHNDGLLLLSVLLAVWAAERDYIRWAVVALTVGTLLKFLPIILLPLVVVYGMRGRPRWWGRWRLMVESVLIFAILTVLAYYPYWVDARTLQNITVREGFVTSAPLAVVSYALRQAAPLRWINDLLITLNLPHPADANDVISGVSRVGSGLLAVGLLWHLWHLWRNGRGIWRATFGLLLWYLTLGSQWFQPWYVLWLLGLLALRPDRRTWAWLAAWSLAGQASYLLQYFGQPRLSQRWGNTWSGQGLPIQTLYCLIIFVPPLIVWSYSYVWERGRRAGETSGHEEGTTDVQHAPAPVAPAPAQSVPSSA